jgi:cysteine synthase A
VGRHRIQGVSDEFIPGILRLDSLAPVIQVSDGDAILMAQKLARELGLGVGISSGANLLGALQVLEREGWGATVATIFCDLLRRQQEISFHRPRQRRARATGIPEP